MARIFHDISHEVMREPAVASAGNRSMRMRTGSIRDGSQVREHGALNRCRRAVTLLEVLISIFVLAIGLLSVASLVPVASFQRSARLSTTARRCSAKPPPAISKCMVFRGPSLGEPAMAREPS